MNAAPHSTAQTQALLIAYDLSETGSLAVRRGLALAHMAQAAVHIAYVAAPLNEMLRFGEGAHEEVLSWDEAEQRLRQAVQTHLVAFAEQHAAPSFSKAFSHLRSGSPVREICTLAHELHPSLIIAGTHGRSGVKRALLGSVAEGLVRDAPCPVLVVRPFQFETDSRRLEIPAIEDACPRCVEARRESGGTRLWCRDHSEGLGRRHTYHEVPRSVRQEPNLPLVIPMNT